MWKSKENSTYRFMITLTGAWWNPWMIQLIYPICISNSLSSLHTQMVGKVNSLMYLTLFQHKCPISKFSRHQMDSICSCLDVFCSDMGHMIPNEVMWFQLQSCDYDLGLIRSCDCGNASLDTSLGYQFKTKWLMKSISVFQVLITNITALW